MRLLNIETVYVDFMPTVKEFGKLYISQKYEVAIHLCACGCGRESVTPLTEGQWKLIKHPCNVVTLIPSIGNFNGESPYHAHYFIDNSKIIWL